MKKYTIPSLILAAFMLVASSCHHDDDNDDTRAPYVVPDSLMRTLTTDTVKVRNITDEIKFNGLVNFNADKVVTVYPLITGNVQGITVVPGDYVHKGQTLGVVMSAEIANYNSALITAETNVRLTQRQLDQQKEMFKSGLASQVDLTNAEVAYEQAVASKIAASKIMSINGNNKNGEYDIKSPIDGFIVQMNVSSGTAIRSDNNVGLFTISDLKNVWVEANVYEANIGKVKQGDTVQVTTISYPNKVFNGRVDKIMNVLDPSTKTLKMRVVLNNPDYLLKPQMFATVRLNHNETSKAVSVSSKALVFDNSQYYVIVITGKKNVAIRPVQVAGNNGDVAYIKSGLAPGERVVASNALLIYGSLNN